jgi:hypothetical protein
MSIAAKFVLLLTLAQPVSQAVDIGHGNTITFVKPNRSDVEIGRFTRADDCNEIAIGIDAKAGEAFCVELDDKGNVVRVPQGDEDVRYIGQVRQPDLIIRVERR